MALVIRPKLVGSKIQNFKRAKKMWSSLLWICYSLDDHDYLSNISELIQDRHIWHLWLVLYLHWAFRHPFSMRSSSPFYRGRVNYVVIIKLFVWCGWVLTKKIFKNNFEMKIGFRIIKAEAACDFREWVSSVTELWGLESAPRKLLSSVIDDES